ncbi:MAG TPA: putative peptidoglycan-binding domain-containing protein [Oligoflexus sp.]|uniref:putative peptidoglycan-binding domain-containing protein n=1 Tax=Oligoflexus sp. TaxID=1971216 RepID=UPI002D507ED4|nr:putative peptidoglycan-binding domain-containing protein [Oligoflexus sp.]HYX33249.1 putative peptidoglycan-binding domain-containing protein [Oligoflexus sp.]
MLANPDIFSLRVCKRNTTRFSPRLALPLFDAAVNHGPRTGIRIFQEALNRLGADLVVDGVAGEMTVKAAKSYSPRRVLAAFLSQRLQFYRRLETYKVFGLGWDRRIIELAVLS